MWNDKIKQKAQPLINKFNEKGYSDYAYTVMGFLAFGSHNDGNEETTINKFSELLDKSKDEHEFLKEASAYFNL